jgi:hypothetical protein
VRITRCMSVSMSSYRPTSGIANERAEEKKGEKKGVNLNKIDLCKGVE